jgi:hypothetical protein
VADAADGLGQVIAEAAGEVEGGLGRASRRRRRADFQRISTPEKR